MKRIVLSTILAVTLGTVSATAGVKFYTDANGQVFVTPGEGRTLLNVNPQEVMNAMQVASQTVNSTDKKEIKEEIKAELKEEMKKDTPVFAKSSKLKFSGTHYLGYNYKSYKDKHNTVNPTGLDKKHSEGNFELRRNYLQVKAYLFEDPKSYFRVTLDTVYDRSHDDHADIYAKYAYIYLDDVLPFTGVELGMAHRPWIDYEEHQGWWMRSISKVFVEASEAAHLTNSADLGVNFKTKTPYFTSEVGLFNGEGYHGKNDGDDVIGDGNSLEWRFTGAFMGNGDKKRKPTKDTYLDASFFGQLNMDSSKNEGEDYTIMGVHAVYNMPSLLLAAQYVTSDSDLSSSTNASSDFNGKGYSLNGTFRFGAKKEFSVLARFDRWEAENEMDNEKYKTDSTIYGAAWQQNKNLKWLLTGQTYKAKNGKKYSGSDTQNWDSAMLTAEVHW